MTLQKNSRASQHPVECLVRPRLLDLFCGAGGAGAGYHLAGFEVVGVDISHQPRYPFEFHRADAMTFDLAGFDVIHASPPCQRYTALGTREDLSNYPDLVDAVRERLQVNGKPWIIENVPGSPLRNPITLCGAMFGLRSYRHRLFESSEQLIAPPHPRHEVRVNRRGENRREHWDNGGFITITGDVGTYCGPEAMGIDWMSGNELSQAIPPIYTFYIGMQLRRFRWVDTNGEKSWFNEDSGVRWRHVLQDPKYALLADLFMGAAGKHAGTAILDNSMA